MTDTTIRTLAMVEDLADTKVLEYLDRQATIPLSAGLQRQGDVGFIPTRILTRAPRTSPAGQLPAGGIALVSSGQGGHIHLLVGSGPVTWAPIPAQDRTEMGDVGIFTVPTGAEAYVIHPEHGAMGFAPGSYLVRRQVEQADELRLVAD